MVDISGDVCPKCQVGFAPNTGICPFCNVRLISKKETKEEPEDKSELEFEEEYQKTPEPVILEDDLSSLERLRAADVYWVSHLQGKLAAAGIPYCTELSEPPDRSFSVYVRPKDLPRAQEIDEELFVVEVPDSEGMPHVEDLDFWTCPGCGNRLGEKDLECKNCGLVLSATEKIRCKNCDEVIEAKNAECPYCGCAVSRTKR